MPIVNRIADFVDEMTAWRRDIHAHPETAYEEVRTSALVAEKLASFGVEVTRGLGRTGVVGTLRGARGPSGRTGGDRAIGLRADMDALNMQELNDFAHRSTVAGKMHGCGHDGHTAMLLGAAKYLAETRNFAGTVHFIFQPAEEGAGGGKAMIDDGLFQRFPMEQVFGMHNWPDLPVGAAAVHDGAAMASADFIDIEIEGRGAHGAMPHQGVDPIVVAAHIVTALQALVSRETDPLDQAVLSITQIHAGTAYNVIPSAATLGGTVRTFRPETRDRLEAAISRTAIAIGEAFGATVRPVYRRNYPATRNSSREASLAAEIAAAVVGPENVHRDVPPSMGAEDFSFMLEEKPGAYIWLGQAGGPSGCMLHNQRYDFNDAILPIGASYWARLVETLLAA